MSIEKVKAYLTQFDADGRVMEFSESSATVAMAAHAVGCEETRIAKTLSFVVDGDCVLIVCAGDVKIDNPKFKSIFHTKAKMPSIDEVEALCGHSVGGVCPFAVNRGVKVYLDESMRRFETVYPACGSSNSAIELTLDELENFSNSLGWIDVCKSI